MQQDNSSFPAPFKPLLVLLSLAGGVVGFISILLATQLYGPGISHDSVAYLYASQSLLEGRGFEYFGYPSPYIQWPPLLPTVLAAARLLGVDAAVAGRFYNASVHAGIIVVGGLLLAKHLRHRATAATGILLLVFSAPVIRLSKYIWTEPAFILLTICTFSAFERYLHTQRQRFLILAAVFSSLAWLDRYIGITVAASCGVFLLLLGRRSFRRRCQDLFYYGVITTVPILAWITRNYLLSGTTSGLRSPSTDSLATNLRLAADAFISWTKPDPLGAEVATALRLFTAAVLLAGLAALAVVRPWRRLPVDKTQAAGMPDARVLTLQWMLLFAAIYLAQLIGSATWVAFESITGRFISLVYPPLVIACAVSADLLLSHPYFERKPAAGIAYRVALAASLLLPMLVAAGEVRSSRTDGAGVYASTAWQENLLIRRLRERPRDACGYYSNYADGVYALTGIHAYMPPKKTGLAMYGLDAFRRQVEQKSCNYVVWFTGWSPLGTYNINELGALFQVEAVEQNTAGVLYRLSVRR